MPSLDEEPLDRSLLRIAVVDDVPQEAQALAQDLSVRGYSDVEIVENASEVVRTFREFDVLLLDLDLGDVDGIELAERVLTEQPDKWIFVVSGNHPFLRRLDRRDLRVKAVFQKPLYPNVMAELVKEADQLTRKRQRIVHQVETVTTELLASAECAGQDVIAAQRGLATAKEGFRKYFLPTSRMRAARTGASARRAIVLLTWTVLQRLSFVPSESFKLIVPTAQQLQALAEAIAVLRGRGLTTVDEDFVDELLWGVGLWPGKGSPADLSGFFEVDDDEASLEPSIDSTDEQAS